jgi:hypothetical protein
MNMTQEEIYNAEQDHNEYQRLINTVEILTQAEYEICRSWDMAEAGQYLFNVGDNRWLNTLVYSEAEHHDRIYRMECGL